MYQQLSIITNEAMFCQDYENKGGKIIVPVGCNGLEDWLLDSVDVPKLIPLLRKGAALLCMCRSYAVHQPAQSGEF